MRRGAVNWLSKLLLALLIVAFAVWGVADVFRGYGRGTLARIGDTEITVEEYRQAYQDELTSVSRRIGRRITPEQAKMLGVEQRALSRLIGAAAIDTHARELHLALSEKGLAEIIREDSAFQDAAGKFSNTAFQSYLRQTGNTEARYVAQRRKEELRDQVTDSLLGGLTPPKLLIELLHRYREETRVIEYFTPDYAKLVKTADPDDAALKAYYEQNKRQFVVPELRKINVLSLTRADAKGRIKIDDADVKTAYDQDKEKFNVAEKRRIQQLAFPDKAAADKAYAELAKAKDFNAAAVKLGFKESDFDLGLLTRRDMIDGKIAEAAFALKKDELSKPVEGQFALVLVRVSEIVPGKQRTFDDVKGELKERLADERASVEIQGLHDKIEDARSAGTSLKDIGASLNVPFREIAEIDRAGKMADGKPAIDTAQAGQIAQAAFAGTPGIEADAAELADGGYAWIDVLGVTPEKQKPLEEVTADVKAGALEQARRTEIATFAAKLAERLAAGETMEAVAKEIGAKVEKTPAITRATSPQGLTPAAVQQAFALPKGGAGSAATIDGKARTLLRVGDVIAAPAPTAEQAERIKAELARNLQTDILSAYVAGLQTRYGLSINEPALKSALGGASSQQDLE
jgi:peptidyl-prolyl cis-trans isomerase D